MRRCRRGRGRRRPRWFRLVDTPNMRRSTTAAPSERGYIFVNPRAILQLMRTPRLNPRWRVGRMLGDLDEFLDHPIALQLREIVYEQHAVEMVDLMLQHGRKQVFGEHFLMRAIAVDVAHANARWPLDLPVIFGDGEAALLVRPALVRGPDDLRIDEIERSLGLVRLGGVDDDQPDRLA